MVKADKVYGFPSDVAKAKPYSDEKTPNYPLRIVECWRGDCLTGFRVQRWCHRYGGAWINSGRKYLTKDGAIGHRTYLESLLAGVACEEYREVL